MSTDYDAPRVRADDEPADALQSLVTTNAAARAADGATALEDARDDLEAIDVPDLLIDGELTSVVIPQQAYEARCTTCFLVKHASMIGPDGQCADCR